MRLLSLSLEHFRNYSSVSIDLSACDFHLFIGPNGAGKTNILESMSMLSLTKSFLGVEERDLVEWQQLYYRIKGRMCTDSGDTESIEVVCEVDPRRKKALFLNDVSMSSARFVGRLPTVTFIPQDLHLFSGAPSMRRRFIDQLLCQVSSEYLANLSAYTKSIKQRNALLKQIAKRKNVSPPLPSPLPEGEGTLDVWDQKVAESGSAIILSRLELIQTLNCTFMQEVCSLGEDFSSGEITYVRRGEERTLDAIRSELIENMAHYRERDLILQTTTIGPHRDDWCITMDGHDLTSFASRGQQRVCLLTLLFLEVSYLELKRGERPIILLDDVFSELDDAHREAFFKTLGSYQIFVTGNRIPQGLEHLPHHQVWEVDQGEVKSLACPESVACPQTHHS
jgi:DNA replication and repair protein RecF